MTTMTLTEFNQNPSRVVRLMEDDDGAVVRVTKRGVPLFVVTPIPRPHDRLPALIAAGLATPPADTSREPIDYGDDSFLRESMDRPENSERRCSGFIHRDEG